LKVGKGMKSTIRITSFALLLVCALVICLAALAQQSNQSGVRLPATYDVSREGSLVGTVVKFDPASATPPIGAHLLLQTSSGQVDVHLGNARLLQASHLDLNDGDTVRIVGENLSLGDTTFFAARIVQKGTQAVAVRNLKGFALAPVSALTHAQLEAIRGAR
jgi:hypothetical protein